MSFILYQKRSWDSPNVALNRKVKLGVDLRSFSVVGRFLFYAASLALSSLGFGGQRPLSLLLFQSLQLLNLLLHHPFFPYLFLAVPQPYILL